MTLTKALRGKFPFAVLGAATVTLSYHSRRTFNDGPPLPSPESTWKDKKPKSLVTERERESYTPAGEEDGSAWGKMSRSVGQAKDSMTVDWQSVGEKITDFVAPAWARSLPGYVRKLQFELTMEPGTLADQIWTETLDAEINPEIEWDASVRVSNDLCADELDFQRRRKQRVISGLASYLGVDEAEIDLEDVPTIAICGSGGGLRALVAGTGSLLAAQEDGLLDCVTYTAGVSGSCWLQTLFHSSLGKQDYTTLARHLKNRIGVHIALPPPALKLICSAPTNKFLMSGFVEKMKGDPGADFGLVDIYGLLLAGRLMVPKGELGVCDADLKLSNQRKSLQNGEHPMPIYTAVRHEMPKEPEEEKHQIWFQWFEFSPYEVFCEEFSAGIPTWALGRPFKNGHNVILDDGVALPELRVPLLLGIWGSAFCATLSHYYKEVKPVLLGLTGFGGLNNLLTEKDNDLSKIHPIDPATIPNFVYGMEGKLPSTCPQSIFESDHLQLMDAGMSNNLPIYPLLRPGRGVDVLIAFDASADIKQENWLSIVDGYARQRGVQGWPIGAGWPKASPAANVDALDKAQAASVAEAAEKVEEAESPDLGYCTVWVGTKIERASSIEPPPSTRLDVSASESDTSFHLLQPNAGLTLVYFPFVANPKVSGVDPETSEFMSTWNFIYKPEDVDAAIALAKQNYDEGRHQLRRCVRAVWERKRALREGKKETWLDESIRKDGDHFA